VCWTECQCELSDPSIVITNLLKKYCSNHAIVIKIKIACCFYICQLFLYMPTILYMPTVSIYAHCFYICPMCLYMPTVFRYAHCVLICPLCLDMLTVHMLTVFIYGHCRDICSLSLHMLLKKRNPNPDSLYLFEQHSSVCVYISYE
jgi:hypothetical protein